MLIRLFIRAIYIIVWRFDLSNAEDWSEEHIRAGLGARPSMPGSYAEGGAGKEAPPLHVLRVASIKVAGLGAVLAVYLFQQRLGIETVDGDSQLQ